MPHTHTQTITYWCVVPQSAEGDVVHLLSCRSHSCVRWKMSYDLL